MSATGLETTGVNEWLQTVISGDVTLNTAQYLTVGQRVHADVLPAQVAFPAIYHRYITGRTEITVDHQRYGVDGMWEVVVVDDRPSYARIRPIAGYLARLLNGVDKGETADTWVHWVEEQTPIQRIVPSDGDRREAHLGGQYRIIAQDRADVP